MRTVLNIAMLSGQKDLFTRWSLIFIRFQILTSARSRLQCICHLLCGFEMEDLTIRQCRLSYRSYLTILQGIFIIGICTHITSNGMVARSCFSLSRACARIIRIIPSPQYRCRIIRIIFVQHTAIVSICTCGLSAISVVISVERIQSIRYTFILNRFCTLWRIDSSKWCAVRRTRRTNP